MHLVPLGYFHLDYCMFSPIEGGARKHTVVTGGNYERPKGASRATAREHPSHPRIRGSMEPEDIPIRQEHDAGVRYLYILGVTMTTHGIRKE